MDDLIPVGMRDWCCTRGRGGSRQSMSEWMATSRNWLGKEFIQPTSW